MASLKLSKAELEYYINAKPGATEHPGYFKDGKFHHITHYSARLGRKRVSFFEAEMEFAAKMQELLDRGEHT